MKLIRQISTSVVMLAALASLTAAQINRPVTTTTDSPHAQVNPTPEPGPQLLELRCRGPRGLQASPYKRHPLPDASGDGPDAQPRE